MSIDPIYIRPTIGVRQGNFLKTEIAVTVALNGFYCGSPGRAYSVPSLAEKGTGRHVVGTGRQKWWSSLVLRTKITSSSQTMRQKLVKFRLLIAD